MTTRTTRSPRAVVLAYALAFALAPAATAEDVLVPAGATWRYLDDGSDQGTAWRAPAFDDSSWATGAAQLGYGDGDEATVVGFGPDPEDKHVTTWFRRQFTVTDPSAWSLLSLDVVRDDGAIVYLNGTEVVRLNMPASGVGHATFALSAVSGATESAWVTTSINPGSLLAGTNTLAVELHQSSAESSDVGFDLRLLAASGPWVDRGPYLQRRTPTGITVSWRTRTASDGWVWLGSSPGALRPHTAGAAGQTSQHVALTGLLPDTTYHYGVGTATTLLAGGDGTHVFRSAPLPGDPVPLRIWAIGDSGTATPDAAAVRDAYLGQPGALDTDVWLMLGDNAYNEGSGLEHQAAIFDMYPELLRRVTVWPTRGNHDALPAYFNIFSMPTAGEAGGVASGTEHYYAFDQGQVHFVCLDSSSSNRAVGGPMYTWLQADLAAADPEWLIAFWHHPPYSKGSHDSDLELELIEMRSNFLPLLEAHAVDLVLSGHSHSYERSTLIDGHYGTTAAWDPFAMQLDGGDGSPAGDGPYTKPGGPHAGTVYAVAGSSGKVDLTALDHPVMSVSLAELGSLVLDVDGATLDGRFLDATGVVRDDFRIVHLIEGTWTDLGGGTTGSAGSPALAGSGSQIAGEPFTLELVDAAPSAPCVLFLALQSTPLPAFGGTFHAVPILAQHWLGTDGTGALSGSAGWPSGLPPGTDIYYQFAILDASVPLYGISLSNGLRSTSP